MLALDHGIVLLVSVIGAVIGYLFCLVMIARDRAMVRVPEDCLIIKKEIFAKLQQIAEVRHKNPRLKFDSRGTMSGVKQDDDDEDPE